MVIEVRLYASLTRYRPSAYETEKSLVTVDVPDDISVGDLLEELEMDIAEVKYVTINGAHSDMKHILADGDRVSLYPAGCAVRPG